MKQSSGFTLVEILVTLTVVAFIGAGGYMLYQHYGTGNRSASLEDFVKTYSDGWYGYSFNYNKAGIVDVPFLSVAIENPNAPQDAVKNLFIPNETISVYSLALTSNSGKPITKVMNSKSDRCDLSISIPGRTQTLAEEWAKKVKSDTDQYTVKKFPEATWYVHHHDGAGGYDNTNTQWYFQISKNEVMRMAPGGSGSGSEGYCTILASTIKPSINPSDVAAQEQQAIRVAADTYMATHYPDHIFLAGSFTQNGYSQGSLHRLLTPTNTAAVAYDLPKDQESRHSSDRTPLVLKKAAGQWQVIRKADSREFIWP